MREQRLHLSQKLPFSATYGLYGRDEWLQKLSLRLSAAATIWISGGAGAGKRAMAAALAEQQLAEQRPVIWITLYHDDFNTLTERLCRLYACAVENPNAETYQTLRQHLTSDQPLLIIGGISTNNDILTVKMLLETCVSSIPTLLLSHVGISADDHIALGALDPDDAEALYRTIGQIEPTRRTALLAPFLNYIDGWPFGLVLAGQQSAAMGTTSTHFASLLPQTPPGPQSRSLGVIDAAFRQLDSTAQGLLLLLSVLFADHVRPDLLRIISGIPNDTLNLLLDTLLQQGFIRQTQDESQMILIHDLVRLYGRRRLQSINQLHQTRARIMQGVLRFVLQHTEHPTPTNHEALADTANHIYGAARLADQLRDTQYTQTLVKLLARHGADSFVRTRGYHIWYQRLQRLAGEFSDVANIEHQFSLRTALMKVSEPAETAESSINESLDKLLVELGAAQANDDSHRVARLALNIGDWYTNRDQLKEAARFYEECVNNAHPQRDYEIFVRGILAAAQAHVELEQPFEALSRIEHGLQHVALQTADRGRMLAIAADARMVLSDEDLALADYQQAAMLLENHRALIPAGITMGKAATILIDRGEYQAASVLLAQAADAFERAGRRDLQGQALGNLGTALGYMGRWREAGKRHMLALQIAQDLNDLDEARHQLGSLAFVSETEGYLDWAVHYGRQALHLSLQMKDYRAAARHATDLGRLLMMNPPMTHQAVVLLEAALSFDPQPHTDALLGQARQLLYGAQQSGYAIYPPQDIGDFARAGDNEMP